MIYKLQIITTGLFVFLLPLFFLPFTVDFFEFNKLTLLLFTVLLLLFLWVVSIIYKRNFTLYSTSFGLPLIILLILFSLSTFLESTYKLGSILSPLGLLTIALATALYFLVTSMSQVLDTKKIISDALIVSGLLLSLIVILIQSNILTSYIHYPSILNKTFSPLGTPYLSFLYLLLPFSLLLFECFTAARLSKLLYLFIILLGISISVYSLIKTGLNLLPLPTSLSIIKYSSQSLSSFLLGFGPGNFLTAFTLGKPLSFNSTPWWSSLFSSSTSYFLTLVVEIGVPSALIYLFITFLSIKRALNIKNLQKNPLLVPLIVVLLIQLFTLSSISLLCITFILLAVTSQSHKLLSINLRPTGIKTLLFGLPLVLIIAYIIISLSLFWKNIYLADVYFKKSIDAIPSNKGQDVYNYQVQAIKLNPDSDTYHVSFSQTNLAIANSLSAQKTLTDDDKQKIPHLIQQSINEARIAVSLNRGSVVDWNNLASIYYSISHFVQGADSWSISSYQVVENLNPNDPTVRLTVGGIYYSEGKFDEAIDLFKQAVSLKPNWANAHYNLSAAYKMKKDYQDAYHEMQLVLSYLPPSSPDYKKAQNELATLQSEISSNNNAPKPQTETPEQSNLSLPAPPTANPSLYPTISIEPPISPSSYR